VRYERVKKKAYVRMNTTHGMLNFELHSDMVPKTCDNFLRLCVSGYYDGTMFHRSIRNFMIQGGDPDGTGLGGQSVWGAPFKDEFKPNLTHSGRGVLSMANSGPNTNKSQFFVTFRSARHLDNKHSVFGRVVGGLETLDKIEAIATDSKDRPKEKIVVINCQVFVNPYEEADEMLKKERESAEENKNKMAEASKSLLKRSASTLNNEPKVYKSGVGKFVNPNSVKHALDSIDDGTTDEPKKKKKKQVTTELKNFSSWS